MSKKVNAAAVRAKPVDFSLGYVQAPPGLADPHAFAVTLEGDCMEPDYLAGEILILSRAAPVTCGSDCLVVLHPLGSGQPLNPFKRVHFGPDGSVWLQMLNPKYGGAMRRVSRPLEIIRCVAKVPASALKYPCPAVLEGTRR